MTLVLGLVKIIKAFWSIDFIQHLCRNILGRSIPSMDEFFVLSASLAVLITAAVVFFISRRRSNIGKIKLA
jgi:hypothetical protein